MLFELTESSLLQAAERSSFVVEYDFVCIPFQSDFNPELLRAMCDVVNTK